MFQKNYFKVAYQFNYLQKKIGYTLFDELRLNRVQELEGYILHYFFTLRKFT